MGESFCELIKRQYIYIYIFGQNLINFLANFFSKKNLDCNLQNSQKFSPAKKFPLYGILHFHWDYKVFCLTPFGCKTATSGLGVERRQDETDSRCHFRMREKLNAILLLHNNYYCIIVIVIA